MKPVVKRPEYVLVDGLRIPPVAIEYMVRDATQFKPEKNDVVVATYLKCGTTWTLQIVSMILRKGQPHTSTLEYFSNIPYVELTAKEQVEQLPRPRCLKIHLPFDKLQFSKEARYIWVLRNPADCLVSLFHHTRFFPCYRYTDGDFDEYFELFINGEVDYNDYFDHMLSWYEHRNEPNVLYMTYESMKEDLRGSVLKIARHIGKKWYESLLENDEEVLKKVLYYSSFDYMKTVVNGFWREAFIEPPEGIWGVDPVLKKNYELICDAEKSGYRSIGQFIRKGVAGDGKITLSDDQKKRLKEKMIRKLGHTDIVKFWEID